MPIRPVRRPADQAQPSPSPRSVADRYSDVSPPARTRSPAFAVPPAPAEEQDVVPAATPDAKPKRRAHHKVDRTGPNWNTDGSYKVGRGKPDPRYQWVPGQSGNSAGPEKKKPLDLRAEYDRKLLAPFEITLNGKKQTIDTLDLAIQSLRKIAAGGTAIAAKYLLTECLQAIHRTAERNRTPETEQWESDMVDRLLDEYGLPARPVTRAERQADDADEGGDDPS